MTMTMIGKDTQHMLGIVGHEFDHLPQSIRSADRQKASGSLWTRPFIKLGNDDDDDDDDDDYNVMNISLDISLNYPAHRQFLVRNHPRGQIWKICSVSALGRTMIDY